jgi:hypothetical protein
VKNTTINTFSETKTQQRQNRHLLLSHRKQNEATQKSETNRNLLLHPAIHSPIALVSDPQGSTQTKKQTKTPVSHRKQSNSNNNKKKNSYRLSQPLAAQARERVILQVQCRSVMCEVAYKS